MRALPVLFAALLAPSTACSIQQGKVPVIDALALPASVTLDADGSYHIDATISYHDDDDEVSRIRVSAPSIGATAQLAAPGGKTATDAPFTFKIVGTAPKGALGIKILILDVEGNASDEKTASVTLK